MYVCTYVRTYACMYVVFTKRKTATNIRPNPPAGHHGTSPDRWHEASGWAAPRVHKRQLGPGKRVIVVFAIYGCKMYGWLQFVFVMCIYIYILCILCDFYVYVVPRYVFIHL